MRIILLCVIIIVVIAAVMMMTTRTITPIVEHLPQKTETVNSQTKNGIDTINRSYYGLQSIQADATILFTKDGTHRLEAKIYGQKPRNFHLRIKSLMGQEVDVGTNNHHFWYWFNRDDPETVYYNVYEKAEVLNIPLNPVWLSECFRLLPVTADNKMVKDEKLTALVKTKAGFLHATIFNPDVTKIRGYYVYDSENKITAFCDIKEEITVSGMVMPKVVNVGFPQDNIYMEWRIFNYRINIDIPESEFIIPDRKMSLVN